MATINDLEKLLLAAQSEHHKYEQKLGRPHKNWARWYAKFIWLKLNPKPAAPRSSSKSSRIRLKSRP